MLSFEQRESSSQDSGQSLRARSMTVEDKRIAELLSNPHTFPNIVTEYRKLSFHRNVI